MESLSPDVFNNNQRKKKKSARNAISITNRTEGRSFLHAPSSPACLEAKCPPMFQGLKPPKRINIQVIPLTSKQIHTCLSVHLSNLPD